MIKILLIVLLLPPGTFASIWLVGWLFRKRKPRLGLGLRVLAIVSIIATSVPYLSAWALHTLQTVPPLRTLPEDAQAIVVLGADFLPWAPEYAEGQVAALTLQRLRHGATWQRISGLPILVTAGNVKVNDISGGMAMAQCLQNDFGVPTRWIEEGALTTSDNARLSAELLREDGIKSIILVTHAWHMRRAMASFQRQGLTVHPAPTAFRPPPRLRTGAFRPGTTSMRDFYWAAHEWLGLAYYALRQR